jgi:hypothetical protein
VIALLVLALSPCADRAACTMRVHAADDLLPVAHAAVADLGIKEGEPKAAALKPRQLKGDTAFGMELERDADQLIVRALSLHRPPSVYGLARVTPQKVPRPEQQRRALQLAANEGLRRAMEDLSEQIREAAGMGQRKLKLSVEVNGLGREGRKVVAETLFPCLKRQLDQLGAVTEPAETAGYLEDEVLYAPAPDEPRDSLQWQVEHMRAAVLSGKGQCSVAGTPLGKARLQFVADALNHAVVVNIAP